MLDSRRQLIILAASAVAWCALAETGLRLAQVRFDSAFVIPDQQLGWSLRPSTSGWQVSEGRAFVTINADGFHDRPRAVPKPAGTYRIAVLGNSWSEALQVPLEDTFCSRLERLLRSRSAVPGARNIEVLNFGVEGYSTAQELIQLRTRVWKYDPDMVLLAFYTARDVLNNVRELNNAATPEQSPYFVRVRDRLVLDASFRHAIHTSRLHRLAQEIRLRASEACRTCQAVSQLVRMVQIGKARAAQASRGRKIGAGDLENVIYSKPVSPEVRNAWEITEDLLAEMNREVRSHGAQFWIVTLANRAQVEFDPIRRARMAAELQSGDLDYADHRIQAFGEREKIPVTSLAGPLRAYASLHRAYLNGFDNTAPGEGHWNALGHQVAAEAIGDAFCELFGREARTPEFRARAVVQGGNGNVN